MSFSIVAGSILANASSSARTGELAAVERVDEVDVRVQLDEESLEHAAARKIATALRPAAAMAFR